MDIKTKVLLFLIFVCLVFGGMMGLTDDGVDGWIRYYYGFSFIPTIFIGAGIKLLADFGGIKNIRTCDIFYSGFVIVMFVSMLFYSDTLYIAGRIVAVFGATIAWVLSMDSAGKK